MVASHCHLSGAYASVFGWAATLRTRWNRSVISSARLSAQGLAGNAGQTFHSQVLGGVLLLPKPPNFNFPVNISVSRVHISLVGFVPRIFARQKDARPQRFV